MACLWPRASKKGLPQVARQLIVKKATPKGHPPPKRAKPRTGHRDVDTPVCTSSHTCAHARQGPQQGKGEVRTWSGRLRRLAAVHVVSRLSAHRSVASLIVSSVPRTKAEAQAGADDGQERDEDVPQGGPRLAGHAGTRRRHLGWLVIAPAWHRGNGGVGCRVEHVRPFRSLDHAIITAPLVRSPRIMRAPVAARLKRTAAHTTLRGEQQEEGLAL